MDISQVLTEIFEMVNVFGLNETAKVELDSIQFAIVVIEIEDRFHISLSQDEMILLHSANFSEYEKIIIRKIYKI
ncbi:MAG: hypothetical protein K1W35_00115 [Lachnospiraceae bacterium]